MRRNISGSSIVVISHQERILNIADEIIVLADGQIKNHGAASEILPEITGTASVVAECARMKG